MQWPCLLSFFLRLVRGSNRQRPCADVVCRAIPKSFPFIAGGDQQRAELGPHEQFGEGVAVERGAQQRIEMIKRGV